MNVVNDDIRLAWQARGNRSGGFTLIELTVVIFIIGAISAIAIPHLLPIIAFSQLEGHARHLANYGRMAIAEATFRRERYVVRFDLDQQLYYMVHWVDPEPEEGEAKEAPEVDQLEKFAQLRAQGVSSQEIAGMLMEGDLKGGMFGDDYDDAQADLQMNDQFAAFARRATEERAKNVVHEDGILSEIGPLFGEKDKFSLEEDEPVEEEVSTMSLKRVILPQELRLEAVIIEGNAEDRGIVELEISPLGLDTKVGFYLVNEAGEYFTVVWDPLMGSAKYMEGRKDIF